MATVRATLDDVRTLMAHATGDEKHEESTTSALDALWVLYDRILRIDPAEPQAEDRDRFIVSKGHGPAALYAILAAKGFFPPGWLDRFLEHDGHLGGHPDRTQVPGIEASTGSLGHGLAMAIGIALALRAKGFTEPRSFVLCGDAELNEGSNWEAILLAPQLRLGNLTLLVIDNHSSVLSMQPWPERIGSFAWKVQVVDGHDHEALEWAFRVRHDDVPTVVVADVPEGEW
jgi:transketolase